MPVTMGTGDIAGAGTASQKAWEAVRADDLIQFGPVTIPREPPREPSWLDALFHWLAQALEPVGRALGMSWPVFKWVLLAILIGALALLAWRMVSPALGWRPRPAPEAEEESWAPATGEASRCSRTPTRSPHKAASTKRRTCSSSAASARSPRSGPDLVEPATTARELAAIGALPEAARTAFATIAARVERSLFALRGPGAEDGRPRAAYAEFARARLAAPSS